MTRALRACATACAFALSVPANAATYLFDSNNDATTINFNGFVDGPTGVIAGLTSSLTLKLLSGAGTNKLRFSFVLTNTSTDQFKNSRVSGFAFNTSPDVNGAIVNLGDFSNIVASGQRRYPNGIGKVEVCLNNANSCAGGGGSGATSGDPATGEFTLSFAQAPLKGVTIDRYFVRYQSLPSPWGSASGQAVSTAVPEPGTWMMLLAGFFAVGFALRKRSSAVASLVPAT